MRNRILAVGIVVTIVGFLGLAGMAQNQMQHRGMAQQGVQPTVIENVVTLTGKVTAVNVAPGQGMPSIAFQDATLGVVTIMVGPLRVLADSKFEFKVGQELQIKAFPDPRVTQAYVATEITDTTGAVVVLRDSSGMPHAGGAGMGRGMGSGMGPGAMAGQGSGRGAMGRGMMHGTGSMQGMQHALGCENCAGVDLQGKKTLAGVVQSVNMSAGQGLPSFTLLAGNAAVTIMAGPFRVLEQAGFQISQGDTLSVVAYPSLQHEGAFVAAEILNVKTNTVIKLRDENGRPIGMQGRGPMHMIKR